MEHSAYSPFGMLRVRSRDGRRTYYSTDEDAHALSSDSGLESGENVVPVRIDNSTQPSSVQAVRNKPSKKRRTTQLPRNMGKRKLRRWMNDHFLDSPSAVRLDPTDPDDQREINSLFSVDYSSVFTEVLGSKEARRQWEEFANFSESQQEDLLDKLFGQTSRESGTFDIKNEPASRKFGRITKRTRVSLRRQLNNPFVRDMEQQIIRYIEEKRDRPLILHIPSSFHRLITHGMCQYYCLLCKSFDAADGNRMTTIRLPQGLDVHVPDILLTTYLERQKEQFQELTRQHEAQKIENKASRLMAV